MRTRDTFDVLTSALAVVCDALAIFVGFLLAVWIRFESGWIPLFHGRPPMSIYVFAAAVGTILFLFIFRLLGLYERPQFGHFTEKVPRIVRAVGLGILLGIALAFVVQTDPPLARLVIAASFLTVSLLVLVERNILFQLERHWAKHQAAKKGVVILGTGPIAAQLKERLEGEPRRRSRIRAFLPINDEPPDSDVPAELVKGSVDELPEFLRGEDIEEVILTNPSQLSHEKMVGIMVQCEQALVDFQMVPDMFRLLTSRMSIQSIDGVPMLGVEKWPLDIFWNRLLKRTEDVVGALLGMLISAPIVAVAAVFIKRGSPGPLFYPQERCGEAGNPFVIYKLRTMPVDSEADTGPVWTSPDDPRRTKVGAFLRRHNLDELPQFWNVLKGDMSLVGPRPERPHFVEQFKDDIRQYMRRHASRPGITGWAQVNGLRGSTDLRDRIKYDLYYLENWSLAFDFKILALTFFRRENAY